MSAIADTIKNRTGHLGHDNLIPLIRELIETRNQEKALTMKRTELETEIAAALDAPDEGSKTHTIGDYKVTVTNRINRRFDEKKWSTIADCVPESLCPVKTKTVLDEPGVRWLRDNEPDLYTLVAVAITATPGKPAVTVKGG